MGPAGNAHTEAGIAAVDRNADDFVRALHLAIDRLPAAWTVCICPQSPAVQSVPPLGGELDRIECRMISQLRGLSHVEVLPSADVLQIYPVETVDDPQGDRLAGVPYTPAFFAALATAIFRRVVRRKRPPFKAIALDCDNTLWSGICGEVGAAGIEVTPAHQALQRFLLAQRDSGIVLCVCSRNNEEDVTEVFSTRQMPLSWDHFVARQVDWRPKSEKLRALAGELGIGLDSFILLDDDPVECAQVGAACPEVLTVQLPATGIDFVTFLRHHWAFDAGNDTEEGRQRSTLYRDQAERTWHRAQFSDVESFIASLDLGVEIRVADEADAARVSELTHRTNQFNTTGIRRSVEDVLSILRSRELDCRVVSVRDRFGDYGLVGVLIYSVHEAQLTVHCFLLSCRALGRGVEYRMAAELGRIAAGSDRQSVVLRCRELKRNRPVVQFLDAIGSAPTPADGGERFYRFSASELQEVRPRYDPPADAEAVRDAEASAPPGAVTILAANHLGARFERVARQLDTAEKILAAVRQSGRAAAVETPYEPPRTATEQAIAGIWTELLGVTRVGVHDDFFDLGGHSLRAVQVLARVSAELGVDVPLRFFFEASPTVARMAVVADEEQLKQADPEKLARLIEEIGSLSDSQIRAQLA